MTRTLPAGVIATWPLVCDPGLPGNFGTRLRATEADRTALYPLHGMNPEGF
jgi:hypothetical protein